MHVSWENEEDLGNNFKSGRMPSLALFWESFFIFVRVLVASEGTAPDFTQCARLTHQSPLTDLIGRPSQEVNP
jgi:hypothetical protein